MRNKITKINKLKIKKRYELVLYYYTSFCHLVLKRITNRITVCSTVPINTPPKTPATVYKIPCNGIQIPFEKDHHQTATLDLQTLSYCQGRSRPPMHQCQHLPVSLTLDIVIEQYFTLNFLKLSADKDSNM